MKVIGRLYTMWSHLLLYCIVPNTFHLIRKHTKLSHLHMQINCHQFQEEC